MRAYAFVLRLLSALFVFTSLAEAWSWESKFDDLSGLVQGHGQVFKKRQNDASTASSDETAKASATDTAAASTATAKATATATGTDTVVETGSASGTDSAASATGTDSAATTGGTKSATGTGTKKSSTTTSIDARLPPGGVSLITPATTGSSSYYKIGNWVTFAWNYTSLSVTPSAVDVLVSCSANDHYYTVALNHSVQATQTVLWDTGAYQSDASIPLLTETYTLVIYDAAKDPTATAGAGYLSAYNQYTFGMYTPQAYTPLNDFTCATCSGALSATERQAIGFVLGMGALTVLSFTCFAGGFGVFR